MKNKEELIKDYLAEPLKIGDKVYVYKSKFSDYTILDNIDRTKTYYTKIISVNDDNTLTVKFDGYRENTNIIPDFIAEKCVLHIGYNPFSKKCWNTEVRFSAFALESILYNIGFDKRIKVFKTEKFGEVEIPELNWNPVIVNSDGNEISYQRDFVWSLNEKQLLIESIYNNIEIGKIIIRKRSWDYVENRVKCGIIENTSFKDIVDGKQRLNAILGFVMNEFPDLNGFYFKDLSNSAQNNFMNFQSVSYGEIGENATDKTVQVIFLNINFAGVQMSKEHIDFVKSIKL